MGRDREKGRKGGKGQGGRGAGDERVVLIGLIQWQETASCTE